jgi:hypothetical protein
MEGLSKLGKEPYLMLKMSTVGIFLTLPMKLDYLYD